jgi:hypothetical protein
MPHESQAVPGGNVSYAVWVWSTVPAKRVTASASIAGHAMRAPSFNLCPAPNKTVCSIGALPANQAFELIVKAHVGTGARVGEQITLTMAVQGTSLSPAEAAVTALVGQASPTPAPTSPLPTLPGVTLPPVPGTTVTPGDLTGLFPVVTPSSTPSPTRAPSAARGSGAIRPTASTLPLDPRLVGGQLAGLAVLAAAITMVVARLSLRPPHPAGPATTPPSSTKTDGEPPSS